MFRYIALIWRVSVSSESQHAQRLERSILALSAQWRCVWSVSGVRVFCADGFSDAFRVHALHDGAGVVLGSVHENGARSGAGRLGIDVDVSVSSAIERTQGEHLIQGYWGNYVAFFRDRRSLLRYVLKDPCGALPCFMTYSAHVAVVFSCIGDCVSLGLKFTPNMTYVRERVVSGGRDRTQEALHEVTPIHGGECVQFDDSLERGHAARLLWHPMAFANKTSGFEHPDTAADALHSVLRGCTNALVKPHAHVLHRLSGGLDSSIVLGCLSHSRYRPHLTAYTYFMPGTKADERPWARLAAAHAQCEHREIAFSPSEVRLERLLDLQPDVEPTSLLKFAQRAPLERALAREREATAVFTGLGGDSGFCSDSSAHALVEYLRLHGPGKHALQIARHVAHLTQRAVWYVLVRSAWIWIAAESSRSERVAIRSASRLATEAARLSVPPQAHYHHPWCDGARKMPLAIFRRLGALPFTPEFYDLSVPPEQSAPEVISPLYAQPVMELCLRIPLYAHFAAGRDRGLARQAFRAEVPPAILERTWKDRAPGYFEEVVATNRTFLQDILLDGLLVSEGLLNPQVLELALSRDAVRSDVHAGEILRHLDTELWLRKWHSAAHAVHPNS